MKYILPIILAVVLIFFFAWQNTKVIAPDIPAVAKKTENTEVKNTEVPVKKWPCEPYPDCKG